MKIANWSIVQYSNTANSRPQLGFEHGGVIREAGPAFPDSSAQLLDEWRTYEPQLRSLNLYDLKPRADAVLVAPITFPRKLICAGANYYDHAEEMGIAPPDPTDTPFFFMKPPTTAIVGDGATVVVPKDLGANVDWEVELGVVIADRCKDVDEVDAVSRVAGYVIGNDLSARGLFPRKSAIGAPFEWDWFSHKSPDGFCPLGPGIVPAWLIENPSRLRMTLEVNGVRKQDSNTANLIVGIGRLIAAASHYVTLEPGDVILTGTPAGVGAPRGEFLSEGDHIVAEIDELGRLESWIAA